MGVIIMFWVDCVYVIAMGVEEIMVWVYSVNRVPARLPRISL